MREIKFRAWDNNDYMSKSFTLQDIQAGHIELTGGDIVMQYTGLKDKNGKEIYEGDVLLIDGKTTRVIESEMSWDWDGATVYGWIIGTEDPHQECEVIGNIYENPDLIK